MMSIFGRTELVIHNSFSPNESVWVEPPYQMEWCHLMIIIYGIDLCHWHWMPIIFWQFPAICNLAGAGALKCIKRPVCLNSRSIMLYLNISFENEIVTLGILYIYRDQYFVVFIIHFSEQNPNNPVWYSSSSSSEKHPPHLSLSELIKW